MTTLDSFKALREEADKAGRWAMYEKGEEIGAPSYSTTCPKNIDQWTCPACKETIKRDGRHGTAFHPCGCLRQAYLGARSAFSQEHRPSVVEAELVRAGVDGILLRCAFANFTPRIGAEDALRICREYAGSFDASQSAGVFLFGPPGSGKTHLAAAVAKAIMEEIDISPLFVEAVHFLREVRNHRGGQDNPIDRCIKAPLLLFDDIANNYNTAYAQEQLYAVVAGRYKAERATIITSNGDAKELEGILGPPLVSRLFQMCSPAELTATDYRTTQSQNL